MKLDLIKGECFNMCKCETNWIFLRRPGGNFQPCWGDKTRCFKLKDELLLTLTNFFCALIELKGFFGLQNFATIYLTIRLINVLT